MSAAPAILAATDFSAHARHAADRAARIAAESSATLTLLHVVPGSGLEQLRGWLGVGTSLEGQLLDDARRQLRELGLRLQTPGAMRSAEQTDGTAVHAPARQRHGVNRP